MMITITPSLVTRTPATHSDDARFISFAFGRRVRSLRMTDGLLLSDLAFGLGISTAHIDDIECGREDVDLELLDRFAEFFDVSLSELLQGVPG